MSPPVRLGAFRLTQEIPPWRHARDQQIVLSSRAAWQVSTLQAWLPELRACVSELQRSVRKLRWNVPELPRSVRKLRWNVPELQACVKCVPVYVPELQACVKCVPVYVSELRWRVSELRWSVLDLRARLELVFTRERLRLGCASLPAPWPARTWLARRTERQWDRLFLFVRDLLRE